MIRLKFEGTILSDTDNRELECVVGENNDVEVVFYENNEVVSFVCLDIPTAIKFAKTIRTRINDIKGLPNSPNKINDNGY